MERKLDINQILKTFDGKPMREGMGEKAPKLTLKRVLLIYLQSAGKMNLNPDEETTAYETGIVIGASEGKTTLTTRQYDLIKKLADYGKIKNQSGQEDEIFGIEVRMQIKEIVDKAETIDKEKEGVV